MFRQAFRQDKIDILPDLSLSGFRDCQFRTGRNRYSCNNLPAILIDKTGLLMIRFEFLITDDLFDPGNDLFFGEHISRKSQVVGIAGISQSVFRCQCSQFLVHLIPHDIA